MTQFIIVIKPSPTNNLLLFYLKLSKAICKLRLYCISYICCHLDYNDNVKHSITFQLFFFTLLLSFWQIQLTLYGFSILSTKFIVRFKLQGVMACPRTRGRNLRYKYVLGEVTWLPSTPRCTWLPSLQKAHIYP